MPWLSVTTIVPSNSVSTSDFLKGGVQDCCSGDWQARFVCVSVRAGVPVTFGGTEEPTAAAELTSIGGIGGEKNKSISKKITNLVSSSLNMPPNRYYVNFVNVEGSDVGWNGETFA
eukprot:jgi/Chlat1/669/Chrsp104S01154